MMKVVGRLLVRNKIAGIFLPIGEGMPPGLYEVIEVMGDIIIRRVGEPALAQETLNGLDLDGLMDRRAESFMTTTEYAIVKT